MVTYLEVSSGMHHPAHFELYQNCFVHVQGISSTDFLRSGLGHHVTALLCSPLDVIEDKTGGKRGVSIAAEYINWGVQVADGWSDLESTADVFACFQN